MPTSFLFKRTPRRFRKCMVSRFNKQCTRNGVSGQTIIEVKRYRLGALLGVVAYSMIGGVGGWVVAVALAIIGACVGLRMAATARRSGPLPQMLNCCCCARM